MKICMYTHGDGGGFWSVAKKGAEQAADDLGIDLDYQESNNDAEAQAQLIEAGVSCGLRGHRRLRAQPGRDPGRHGPRPTRPASRW